MEKAIYGLAMPFEDCYVDYYRLSNLYKIDKTNKECALIDSLVGITLGHDFAKELGRTGQNLQLVIGEGGIYFKLIPNSLEGYESFNLVKLGLLKHCSISYAIKRKRRDTQAEEKLKSLAKLMGWNEKFIVYEYTQILVYEVCLTNNPVNKSTFCTTNKHDARLKGIQWESVRK